MQPGVRHLGATLVALAVALAAAPPGSAPRAAADTAATPEVTELREGQGRDLTVGLCMICHSLDYIPANAPAMNRAGWQKTIQKMKDRFGAPITDEEAKQVLDYLSANYSGKSG
jgi:hypothetical protein